MEKGNVLVIGNSGAGKSTLINAVLGERRAPEGILLISTLKAVPGINIGAITLNVIIAGGIAAGMGEASSFIFEQISLGNRSVDDIDWIKKVLESELTSTVLRKLREVVGKTDGKMSAKDITGIITGVFLSKKKKDSLGKPFVIYYYETRI